MNMAFFAADWEPVRTARARAAKMNRALQFQKRWFDDRWKELEAIHSPPKLVESETQLRDKFNAFKEAMEARTPARLPMDVALLLPAKQTWRGVAEHIADAFVQAMAEDNPGISFGAWDDGPAVKFTLAALEVLGADPRAGSPENARRRIAQRIREIKAAKKKRRAKPQLG